MPGKFLKIVTILSFLLMAFVMSFAFKSVTSAAEGKNQSLIENPTAIINYGRKAMATAAEVANPVLKKFGIDIEGKWTDSSDEVTRHLEEAASSVSEATKKITGLR